MLHFEPPWNWNCATGFDFSPNIFSVSGTGFQSLNEAKNQKFDSEKEEKIEIRPTIKSQPNVNGNLSEHLKKLKKRF